MRNQIYEYCKELRLSSSFADNALTLTGDTCQEYMLKVLRAELDYRTEKRKKLHFGLIFLTLCMLFVLPVWADAGDKPSLVITFENMPDAVFYGGLLADSPPTDSRYSAEAYDIDQYGEALEPIFNAFCAYEDADGFVVGYAFCVFVRHLNDNILTDIKTLYIDDLCVDENCRGKGIGKSLYNYVVDYARRENCYNVTLNVWADNTSALGFYESIGLHKQKIGMELIL